MACSLHTAGAQDLDAYLPASNPGLGTEPGVTVLSRLRPAYDPLGVRLGGLKLNTAATETAGYNSNLTGFSSGRGSSFLRTAATADLLSEWSRGRLNSRFTVDNTTYPDLPRYSFTDWTASIGGGRENVRNTAAASYSHLDLNQTATDFGALPSDTPVRFAVEDLRASYAVPAGRLVLTPSLGLQRYSFGRTTLLGVPVNLNYRDRIVGSAGLAASYPLTDRRSVVVVARGFANEYDRRLAGFPTDTSRSVRLLAGVDDFGRGPWRYRLLAGVEVRDFAAREYRTRVAPILEAGVVWTPNGLTTATLSLVRTIADPADEANRGYVSTRLRLVVDREIRRNVLLQGSLGFQAAEYTGGEGQTNVLVGAGVTWLINRNARAALSYSFNDQSGARTVLTAGGGAPSTILSGDYRRHLIGLSLRLAL